jgi:hypothetical protein
MKLCKRNGVRIMWPFHNGFTNGITKRAVCWVVSVVVSPLPDSITIGQLTIVEPTATLMLSARRSFRETLIAIKHS